MTDDVKAMKKEHADTQMFSNSVHTGVCIWTFTFVHGFSICLSVYQIQAETIICG